MRSARSVLFGLLVLGGSAGVVHAQAAQTPQTRSHRNAMKAGRGPGGRERGLFRGIQLNDAEKASLKTVREKYQSQFKSMHDSFKPQREELRAARQRGDTAAVKAIWTKTADQREKMRALMTQERSEMRTALSADHRPAFDKNVAKLEEHMKERVGTAPRARKEDSLRRGQGRRGQP